MEKCKKHGIYLFPPVGCWKCFKAARSEQKEFTAAKGPVIPRFIKS